MVYKTFTLNSNKISANNSISLPKHEFKDLIPFSDFEGHYDGKVDGLEDTIGVFLTPIIYFPSSSRGQISIFEDINGYVDVKIRKSDIKSYFKQVSVLENIFETDLTVGSYVENRNWVLQEDKRKFLGISEDRTDIEILINNTPVNVYFRTDVNIRIFKKDDVMEHLTELTKNPGQTIHLEIDRTTFKVKDKFGDLMNEDLIWPDFYMELADKLLKYKDNRSDLIQKIKNVYNNINMELPRLNSDDTGNKIDPDDIDPFTIFALFNKQITKEKRINIIKGIKEEFNLKSDTPIDFPGIPVVNNLKATFYYFTERGENDINNLWEVFESGLSYSKDFNEESRNKFIDYYNKAIEQKGIKWNITMGLFWIRPNVFINLDAKNRDFLSEESNVSLEIANEVKILKYGPPVAEKYLLICDLLYSYIEESKFSSFVELSLYAYFYKGDEKSSSNNERDGIGDGDVRPIHYWIYSPGSSADMWDEFYEKGIMAIHYTRQIGDLCEYSNKEEIRETLQDIYQDDSHRVNIVNALWQFAKDVKIGDIIFAKKGMNEIIGRGIVESDYFFIEEEAYPHIRNVKWTHKGNWPYGDDNNKLNRKTLTDISYMNEKVKLIESFFETDEYYEDPRVDYPLYTQEDFLNDVYVSEEDYYTLTNLLKNKKNLIVQGAPGVGKTFMAKRLAYSIMGVKDVDRVMMVQFHQSYSYEDFVMGYRPSKDGFELREGSFYEFCKKAEDDDENDYFFIIDEINRGNLSKIFGELFMLIENDKRGQKNQIRLLYSDELFYIPKNVHIIGLMNTADRSLAMIDYALRRRFAFFDLKPGFSSNGFNTYQSSIDYYIFDNIINVMKELNTAIKEDETLGEGFRIGHSYFCNLDEEDDLEEKLNYIIEYEIIPLLKEYWFDEPDKVDEWSEKLRNCLNQ